MNDWIILRTKGRSTLALAKSLVMAGFTAWTPAALARKRLPRRKERALVPVPLMATYVFAKAGRLVDLLQAADDPMSQHPAFSVFHFDGRIPIIADDDLRGLRLSERKSAPIARQRAFKPGSDVRMVDGPFAGLTGIVERDDGKFVLVTVDRLEVRIARFLLDPGEKMAA